METYLLSKEFINASELNKEIKNFSDKVSSIDIFQGETEYSIRVKTNIALSTSEYDDLVSLVANHNHLNTNVIVWDATRTKIARCFDFGQQILIDFGTENVVMGLSSSEISQLITELSDIMILCQGGALQMAKAVLLTKQPIPVILEQSRIDKYVKQIDDFLVTL